MGAIARPGGTERTKEGSCVACPVRFGFFDDHTQQQRLEIKFLYTHGAKPACAIRAGTRTPSAGFTSAPHSVVLADGGALTVLASAPLSVVLADGGAPAVLAPVPHSVVLADGGVV